MALEKIMKPNDLLLRSRLQFSFHPVIQFYLIIKLISVDLRRSDSNPPRSVAHEARDFP